MTLSPSARFCNSFIGTGNNFQVPGPRNKSTINIPGNRSYAAFCPITIPNRHFYRLTVLMKTVAESGEGGWSPVSKHQIQPGCGE